MPPGEEPCVFQTEAVRGYDIDELSDLHLKLGEGFIGMLLSVASQSFLLTSATILFTSTLATETRSEMVAPIISNDEVIGVFDLESDELNAYSDDDLEVLMLLASQVAIIIEKVMLHEQLIEKKRLQGQLGSCSPGPVGVAAAERSGVAGFRHQRLQLSDRRSFRRLLRLGANLRRSDWIVVADVSGKGVPAALLDGVSAREPAGRDAHRLRDHTSRWRR